MAEPQSGSKDASCKPHRFCGHCPPDASRLRWKNSSDMEQRHVLPYHSTFSLLREEAASGEGCHLCCLLYDAMKVSSPETEWRDIEARNAQLTLELLFYDREFTEGLSGGRSAARSFHCWPQCRLAIMAVHEDGPSICSATVMVYRTKYLPGDSFFAMDDCMYLFHVAEGGGRNGFQSCPSLTLDQGICSASTTLTRPRRACLPSQKQMLI